MSDRRCTVLVILVFMLLGAWLYSNSRHHAFALDDDHSIVTNPWVRSLKQIPHYFVDPKTFTVLHTNVDYRPVLQTTYAVNYHFSGYSMPGWHWTQVGIHVWCAVFLFLLSRELLHLVGTRADKAKTIAALSGLLFLVHPVNSGVVNYISGRSSALTAAFLLAAFTLELKGKRVLSVVLVLFALFTKVEAVASVAVFWALSVLRDRSPWPRRAWAKPKEWLPYLAAVLAYLIVRQVVMRDIDFEGFAGATGVTRWMYLCTQTTAWWGYLVNWFSPLHLVADLSDYPISRGLFEPRVMLAVLGWVMVCLLLWKAAASKPHFPVLALSALALLSPTSSVVVLAEMMNEHRPYLPMALVTVVFAQLLVEFAQKLPKAGRAAVILWTCAWLAVLGQLTWQRNRVFESASTYWADVLKKAPSARAHNNFGLTLMAAGRMEEAKENFEQSVKLAPGYSIAHINLAIALNRLGQPEQARKHYDLSVTFDRGAGTAQLWRGRFFLDNGEYLKALADFQAAAAVSNDHYSVNLGLAQAYAGLGQTERSAESALRAGEIDFPRFSRDIVEAAKPYFESRARSKDGVHFFQRLAARWPNTSWIETNLTTLQKTAEQE